MTPEMDAPTVILTDDQGRSLLCSVEHTLSLDGHSYALLLPVHTPVDLFTWEDEDTDTPDLVQDETEIAEIFSTAQAVMEEHNLTLKWTAITLTVEGELPDLEDEGEGEDDEDDWDGESDDGAVGNLNNGDRLTSDDLYDNDVNGQYDPTMAAEDTEDDEVEEFQLLARFYHEEREYGVYVPLNPFFIPVRLVQGQPQLLNATEFERIEPLLSATLEEDLDSEGY
ncbi:DUF3727 domain-containing protein [Prochlorothrix hollandica]|nr:DUF3727 domain-containing protein [Prochlorothrix hollandica]